MSPPRWGTRIGAVLAVMGCAVGLGNFLMFPSLLHEHGGGFLIPYAIALLVMGLPLCLVEWTMGRAGGAMGRHSTPGILVALTGRRWLAALGGLGPALPLVIFGYYVVIEGLCLHYALGFAAGMIAPAKSADAAALWNAASGALGNGSIPGTVLAMVVGCVALNAVVLLGGIRGGIERVCNWGMPLLILCAVAVIIRVLTLDPITDDTGVTRSVGQALDQMWSLERTAADGTVRTLAMTLGSAEVWIDAAKQVFFTLSVGMGVIITYASYLRPSQDVVLGSMTAASGNEFCEVGLGAMMTVPAAVLFLGPAAAFGTFGLGFVSLPNVFALMPMGQLFGAIFFFLLFLAALTSSISMLQPAIAFFEEGFARTRRTAILAAGAIALPGVALALYATHDFAALDAMDFWAGGVGLMVLGGMLFVVFSIVWGLRRGMAEMRRSAQMRVPRLIAPLIAVVAPLAIAAVLIGFVISEGGLAKIQERLRAAGGLASGYAFAVILLFVILGFAAWRRLQATPAGSTGDAP